MSSINGDSLADIINNASYNDGRKVSLGKEGSTVVNEGNSELFKKTEDGMGKDQFLNLLVAQLRYQDPLNPAEDTQFVAQLAQFSQLEFTQNSTAAISALAKNMQDFMDMQNLQAQSITNASATPLLGKNVRVMESVFEHKGKNEREFNIHLEGTKQGVVHIIDADGNTVAQIDVDVESSKGGDTVVKWDGKDQESGDLLLGGKYTVEVRDIHNSKKVGYAYQDGVVTGVNFNGIGASLTVNGTQFGLSYLVSVEDATSAKDGKADDATDDEA